MRNRILTLVAAIAGAAVVWMAAPPAQANCGWNPCGYQYAQPNYQPQYYPQPAYAQPCCGTVAYAQPAPRVYYYSYSRAPDEACCGGGFWSGLFGHSNCCGSSPSYGLSGAAVAAPLPAVYAAPAGQPVYARPGAFRHRGAHHAQPVHRQNNVYPPGYHGGGVYYGPRPRE